MRTIWVFMRHPFRWMRMFCRLVAHGAWQAPGDFETDYADTDRDTGKTDGMEGYDGL